MLANSRSFRLMGLILTGIAMAPGGAWARVGETRADIEKRIVQPGVGRILQGDPASGNPANPANPAPPGPASTPGTGAAGTGRRGAFGGGRGGRAALTLDPFREIRPFLPKSLVEVTYLKSDAPINPTAPKTDVPLPPIVNLLNPETCWHQHVLYSSGRSVIEAYVRVGVALSEFEVNGVLALNKGGSVWKKVDNGSVESGIGTEYILDDGSIRAKQDGNALLIFATKVDDYILEQQKGAATVEQGKAPTSVLGF